MLYPGTHCPSRVTEGSWKIRGCIWNALYAGKLFYKGNKPILDVRKSHIYGTPCPFPWKERGCLAATGSLEHEVSFKERWVERKGMVFTLTKQAPIFSWGWTLTSPQSVSGKQQVPSVPVLIPNALCGTNKCIGKSPSQLSTSGCVQRRRGSTCKLICAHVHEHFCWLMSSPPLHLTTSTSAF